MIGPGESDFHKAHETYLSPLDAGDEQEKCIECNGKGEFKLYYKDKNGNDEFEPCEICEGSGYVDVIAPTTEAEYFDKFGRED